MRDEPTIEVMNALGVEFDSVGNHELDVSKSFLVDHMARGKCFGTIGVDSCFTDSTGRRFHGADFSFQSANIVDAKGRTIVAPYTIRWVRDQGRAYPVGFIGLTVPDTPSARRRTSRISRRSTRWPRRTRPRPS